MIDQHQQTHTQTTIAGNVTGQVLSGNFQEQVTVIMLQLVAILEIRRKSHARSITIFRDYHSDVL